MRCSNLRRWVLISSFAHLMGGSRLNATDSAFSTKIVITSCWESAFKPHYAPMYWRIFPCVDIVSLWLMKTPWFHKMISKLKSLLFFVCTLHHIGWSTVVWKWVSGTICFAHLNHCVSELMACLTKMKCSHEKLSLWKHLALVKGHKLCV